MSEFGNLISKTQGSKDGYIILSFVAASILYEFIEYCPLHLFDICNLGTDDTPSTFAITNSNSLRLIV
jgi:hypothetical protein